LSGEDAGRVNPSKAPECRVDQRLRLLGTLEEVDARDDLDRCAEGLKFLDESWGGIAQHEVMSAAGEFASLLGSNVETGVIQ
jgi:hypothetical protein